MKLSQTTDEIFSVFGFGEGIDVMADAGFDAVDLAFYNLMCRDEFSEDNAEKTCEKYSVASGMPVSVLIRHTLRFRPADFCRMVLRIWNTAVKPSEE